jgi:phage replication O-like protein O
VANPQTENGYTMIANELLEALMQVQLAPNDWQVLLCIIRKTYGFKKKVDRIANFQIMQYTSLRKDVVSRCLSRLVVKSIITRDHKLVGVNKNYETWKLAEQPTKKLTKQPTELAEQPTKVGGSHVTQKKKEPIQKKEEDINKINKDDYIGGRTPDFYEKQKYSHVFQR